MTPQFEASNLITPIVDLFKVLNAEWHELMETGLAEYLQSQTEKYYFTNTFLHRKEKVVFDEIYYPIKSAYKKLRTDFSQLEDILDEYKSIVIIGSAGSGKTTLIKYIFLTAIRQKIRIPILIELRNLNDSNFSLEKLISEKVLDSKLKPSDNIFKRTLKDGKFLFLFDGYDEIFSQRKQKIKKQIEDFVDLYSENRFIITTRPGSGIEGFNRFYNFNVLSLRKEEVSAFILKMVDNKERRETIIKIVNDDKNRDYLHFLKNPLLLSMFILAFESHPEIPGRKSAFYRNVFDTLYSKHDGITKNSFPREKRTGLQREDFESILSTFSYMSLLDGKYTFTYEYLTDALNELKSYTDYTFTVDDLIYDFQTSISILVLDGLEYSFPHRSMQEYFAALFISRLDTDDKKEAYNNLSKVLNAASTDNSFTLWRLCFELDEKAFLINFLIPKLKIIYNRLKGKKGDSLIVAFGEIVKPDIFKSEKFEYDYRIFKLMGADNSIIDFCEAYNYDEVWKFPENSGCGKELAKLNLDKVQTTSNGRVLNFNHEDVRKILLENNFEDIIVRMRAGLLQKITHWEESVTTQAKSISKLLSRKKK